MPLSAIFRSLQSNRPDAYQAMKGSLGPRLWEIVASFWDLGFTSFGGPAVHFQILRKRFVDAGNGRIPWIDDQTVSFCARVTADRGADLRSIKSCLPSARHFPDRGAQNLPFASR